MKKALSLLGLLLLAGCATTERETAYNDPGNESVIMAPTGRDNPSRTALPPQPDINKDTDPGGRSVRQ